MAKKTAPGGNLQELKTQLKNKDLGRLYIFHGEEVFLLHHYLEQMKKQLLDALTESFNFHRMNSETFDLQTFADAVENLPMMAEHTMVQVDEVDLFKLGESDRNKIAEILSDIPDYCTVVFTYETTPWKPDKRLKSSGRRSTAPGGSWNLPNRIRKIWRPGSQGILWPGTSGYPPTCACTSSTSPAAP